MTPDDRERIDASENSVTVPRLVAGAMERAAEAGFALSCAQPVGRLLAVLSASVGPRGRILELGTGAGVGLAWIVSGVADRDDVEVVSIENDPVVSALNARHAWPPCVTLHSGDALGLLESSGEFDLIFADAQGGKTEGLARTVAALRPGGVLVVDDMSLRPGDLLQESLWPLLVAVRESLLGDRRLVAAELDWSTGVILATRRAGV